MTLYLSRRRVAPLTRVYSGTRRYDGSTLVSVNGQMLSPRPAFRSDAATPFDWGYEGNGGPAQLALAILADHFADDEKARWHYQAFTRRVIRSLPVGTWSLTSAQIDAWCPRAEIHVPLDRGFLGFVSDHDRSQGVSREATP